VKNIIAIAPCENFLSRASAVILGAVVGNYK